MRTSKNIITLFLAAWTASTVVEASVLPNDTVTTTKKAAANDSEYDEEMSDSTTKTRRNTATEFNALKYVMEGRYRKYGDEFTNAWYDHLFIEIGAGLQQIVPPSDSYRFSPMTTVHLGVGKQFSPLHTARLSFSGAFGYQRDRNLDFKRYGLQADWIFSVSSYFSGYNPSRLLDVSTVLGIGGQYTVKDGSAENKTAFEAHAGLQLRFFSGPQGYLTFEPTIGIASDNIDQSDKRNWRKRDIFYGANISFVYYLHNNLSPEERMRYIRRHIEKSDSTMPAEWRTPWFFQVAGGINMLSSETLGMSETLGHSATFSIGKWLSPAVGLRASASRTTTTWTKDITPAVEGNSPEYTLSQHNYNGDIRIEAMVNPLGFLKSFSWESPYGFYLVGGGGMGWIQKNQDQFLRCKTTFYTVGLHLWAKLEKDIHVFIEPRYTYYNYKIPYENVSWWRRYSDDGYGLNIGLSINTRSRDYRGFVSGRAEADADKPHILVGMGLCGGFNLLHTKSSYGSNGMGYNAMAFAEYHINSISSVRLSFEYLSVGSKSMDNYTATKYSIIDEEFNETVNRRGLWNYRYNIGLIGLNYMVNASNLLCGFDNRRFELEAFAGPAMLTVLSHSSEIDGAEILPEGVTVNAPTAEVTKNMFGVNAGVKLKYNITDRLSATFTPQIYLFKTKGTMPGLNFSKATEIETINLGVQYNLWKAK